MSSLGTYGTKIIIGTTTACSNEPRTLFRYITWNGRQPLCSTVHNNLCSIVPIITIKNNSNDKEQLGARIHIYTRV
jgi:hypothetical protein